MTTINKLPASVTGDASNSLIRPKFSAGLLLQDDDLTQAVNYMRDMTRLLFRSMLGCGVLCGFKVEPSIVCKGSILQIKVGKGLALDCDGELIELPTEETIEYAPPCSQGAVELPKEPVWVLICRRERDCSPRDKLCSTQDGELAPVYTRTREGFEIKIIEVKEGESPGRCACDSIFEKPPTPATQTCCDYIAVPGGDKDCHHHHYEGDCACDCQCDCIVLAKVFNYEKEPNKPPHYVVDHSVRRYIRPVLMKDPLLGGDQKQKQSKSDAKSSDGQNVSGGAG